MHHVVSSAASKGESARIRCSTLSCNATAADGRCRSSGSAQECIGLSARVKKTAPVWGCESCKLSMVSLCAVHPPRVGVMHNWLVGGIGFRSSERGIVRIDAERTIRFFFESAGSMAKLPLFSTPPLVIGRLTSPAKPGVLSSDRGGFDALASVWFGSRAFVAEAASWRLSVGRSQAAVVPTRRCAEFVLGRLVGEPARGVSLFRKPQVRPRGGASSASASGNMSMPCTGSCASCLSVCA
mmetsp:Transcript_8763/g.20471  ORF Transcript_8763/g.20471 Transcript_8763/m.20471 type:complete len:240 (-) Transcript_8763:229-948(-)